MEDIRIYCENTSAYVKVEMGTTLADLSRQVCPALTVGSRKEVPVLAALVDNKLKSLDYKIINPHNVCFIGYDHPDGRRTYIRSLCFVLQKVIRELYPDKILVIDYSLPSGLYCEIREIKPIEDMRPSVYFATDEELQKIEDRMQELIEADLAFTKNMLSLEECETLFSRNGQKAKVNLLKTLGRFNYNVYFLDGQADTFYGPLLPSTGYLKIFNIAGFNDGFCLQYPMEGDFDKVL